MKKVLGAVLVLALICTLFAVSVAAKANVTEVWFEGENVKVRAGADLSLLCDNKVLSEENATANDFNKSGIVLVQNTNMMDAENNTTATLCFELDSLQSIDSVYLTWYVYHQAIIGLPHNNNLIIGYSTDGENYTEIGAYDFEGETDPTTSFQLDTVIRLGQTVQAKYVSVTFEFGPHGQDGWYCPMWEWVGFTEVGAGLMVDEIGGGGYDEVSEDNTPLDQIDPIVEIPEGATALKHAKFNTSITTGSYTVITEPAEMQNYNVKWTSCALLRPTESEGVYSVVAVQWINGDGAFLFEGVEEGDIVLSVHGDDDTDGTKANRLALTALTTEDTVTFAGYNFEELSFERGAVVYFTNNTLTPDEPSDDPSEDPSEEPEAEGSEEVSEEPEAEGSEQPEADESEEAPAVSDSSDVVDADDEKGGLAWLWIVIAAVVVVAVVVVVVVVAKKKKA